MYYKLALGFFWKGLRKDIEVFVNFYLDYVVKRTIQTKEAININPLYVPLGLFHTITMDFITNLLLDTNELSNYIYNTLLTMTCRFSKAKILIPSQKDQKATNQTTTFANYILLYQSLPKVIISNYNKQFLEGFQ